GDGNAAQPDGHIYVYSTSNIITSLANSEQPAGPTDIEIIPSSDEDAVEPLGITVSPLGDRAYLIEPKEQLLYVYDISDGGATLDLNTTLPTGDQPSALWLTANGQKGYFCSFLGD